MANQVSEFGLQVILAVEMERSAGNQTIEEKAYKLIEWPGKDVIIWYSTQMLKLTRTMIEMVAFQFRLPHTNNIRQCSTLSLPFSRYRSVRTYSLYAV